MTQQPTFLNWPKERIDRVVLVVAIVTLGLGLFSAVAALTGNRVTFRDHTPDEIGIDALQVVIWASLFWAGRRWYALALGAAAIFQAATLLISVATAFPPDLHGVLAVLTQGLTWLAAVMAGVYIFQRIMGRVKS